MLTLTTLLKFNNTMLDTMWDLDLKVSDMPSLVPLVKKEMMSNSNSTKLVTVPLLESYSIIKKINVIMMLLFLFTLPLLESL